MFSEFWIFLNLKNVFSFFIKIILFPLMKSAYNISSINTNSSLNCILFDSIIEDYYNIASIYDYNYTTIKIKKHKSNKNNSLVAVLGILVNDFGLKIEKEMLNWLTPEYQIYKIYQKYPGTLYEYPALKFAEWLTEKKNISFLLYLHTKGATHKRLTSDKIIRKFWKNEFTKPRNKLYINQIINNKTDIATPLSNGIYTWYNGMYISKRAFQLNKIYPSKNRYLYEYLFENKKTRIKGIIAENCLQPWNYLNYYNDVIKDKRKIQNIRFESLNDLEHKFNNFYLILYLLLVYLIKLIMKIYNKKFLI